MKTNNVYNVRRVDENRWELILPNGLFPVDIISKEDIESACYETETETLHFHECNMNDNLDSVWDSLIDMFFRVAFINPTTIEYRQFTAWFDYICSECIGKIITEYYKEQLLNVE